MNFAAFERFPDYHTESGRAITIFLSMMGNCMDFSQVLFWDVNFHSIDFNRHARFVITRVLMRGKMSDWYKIKQYYGGEKIIKEATKARYLDNKTLSFCSNYFGIPKTKFRCYTTKQYFRKLWPY